MKVLYLDCFGGLSGDMVLGALIDAGVPLASGAEQLKQLGLAGYSLNVYQAQTHVFRGTRFVVEPAQDHHQPRQTWEDISRLIAGSKLAPKIKEHSLVIFKKLARAEVSLTFLWPARTRACLDMDQFPLSIFSLIGLLSIKPALA